MLLDVLLQNETVTFMLNKELKIVGSSTNVSSFLNKEHLRNHPFQHILNQLFHTDTFNNTSFMASFISKIENVFQNKSQALEKVIVSNSIDTSIAYEFHYAVESVYIDNEYVLIRLVNFEIKEDKNEMYQAIFNSYETVFDVFYDKNQIGRFLIDFNVGKNNLYADDKFPEIINIQKSKTNQYTFTRDTEKFHDQPHVITRELSFFKRIDSLLNGELDELSDEWLYNGEWLRIDLKVLKRLPIGTCEYICGVIYNITEVRKHNDLKYINSIQSLAINTGKIGIFVSDYDKHSKQYFDANDIYADLIGIDKQPNGLYLLKDFEKSLIEVESGIQNLTNVKQVLNSLLDGNIQGTDNHILKVQNLKTHQVKYLISSSEIVERYENNTPKKLGGVIIDITERINMQKRHIEFANKDELTGLRNKRKLQTDMEYRTNGVGIFFDLDDFKKFNDNYGHNMGDTVLTEFATALERTTEEYLGAYCYRLYGDEFFVYIEDGNEDTALSFANSFKSRIKTIHLAYDMNHTVSTSYGFSIYTNGMIIDDFIKFADYEMYLNKITKKKNRS